MLGISLWVSSLQTKHLIAFLIHYGSCPVVISHLVVKIIKYEDRTESHEQLFLHANWEQQTKGSAVLDGTSCCVILECLVTSIACIT